MSETFELIQLDLTKRSAAFTNIALEIRSKALDASALIGAVKNERDQEVAVGAQKELNNVVKLIEKARKAAKEGPLELGRAIDMRVRDFSNDLMAELTRISVAIGDFQAIELAKARAAEALRQKELRDLERTRQEELIKATTHEEIDAAQTKHAIAAAALPVAQAPQAKGQIVREEWEIKVTDIHALYRAHPICVAMEPRLSEIKSRLDMGIAMPGILAEKKVKASVRADTQRAIGI